MNLVEAEDDIIVLKRAETLTYIDDASMQLRVNSWCISSTSLAHSNNKVDRFPLHTWANIAFVQQRFSTFVMKTLPALVGFIRYNPENNTHLLCSLHIQIGNKYCTHLDTENGIFLFLLLFLGLIVCDESGNAREAMNWVSHSEQMLAVSMQFSNGINESILGKISFSQSKNQNVSRCFTNSDSNYVLSIIRIRPSVLFSTVNRAEQKKFSKAMQTKNKHWESQRLQSPNKD